MSGSGVDIPGVAAGSSGGQGRRHVLRFQPNTPSSRAKMPAPVMSCTLRINHKVAIIRVAETGIYGCRRAPSGLVDSHWPRFKSPGAFPDAWYGEFLREKGWPQQTLGVLCPSAIARRPKNPGRIYLYSIF